jgi:hypothetical protein
VRPWRFAVRRLSGQDAADAQEPHELRAVVDVVPEGRPTGEDRPAAGATPASPA